jgi:hypothetical protein
MSIEQRAEYLMLFSLQEAIMMIWLADKPYFSQRSAALPDLANPGTAMKLNATSRT